jgi:hypothetical protein
VRTHYTEKRLCSDRHSSGLWRSGFASVLDLKAAEPEDLYRTKGLMNGRLWKTFSQSSKRAIINAIQDAALYFNYKEKPLMVGPEQDSSVPYFSKTPITTDDLIEEMDRLYSHACQ